MMLTGLLPFVFVLLCDLWYSSAFSAVKGFDLGPLLENALWIDNNEHTAAAGEKGSVFVDNFGDTNEPSPTFADLSRFNFQTLIQRYRPAIFNRHARGGGDDVTQLA